MVQCKWNRSRSISIFIVCFILILRSCPSEQLWAGYLIGESLFKMIKVVAVSTSSTLFAYHIFRFDESRPFELVSFLLVLEGIEFYNLENFVILHAQLGYNQVLCYIIMQVMGQRYKFKGSSTDGDSEHLMNQI